MRMRPAIAGRLLPRSLLVRAALAIALSLPGAAVAQSALVPPGVFDMLVSPGQGASAVEADRMTYDGQTGQIDAEGGVIITYSGTQLRADRVRYNQRTGEMYAEGNVIVRDQSGSLYEMARLEITGGMKQAFINSLTLTTAGGARITATDVNYESELATILTNATYSPCGLCVDEKGRKIGWKVKSARIIYDRDNASVTLEQPSLEVLGIPIGGIPRFWMPDPSQPRATGVRMPQLNYSKELGAYATVPFFIPVGDDIDLLLSPRLMSRQGLLAQAGMTWRLPEWDGTIIVKASGLYQLDKAAFAGRPGDRDWRGAIQTSGEFTPAENWTVGWSYSVFTDNAYLSDYGLTDSDTSINQAYATYLADDVWFDARLQRFNRLGDYWPADDDQQGPNVPRVGYAQIFDLGPGAGRINLRGDLLGVTRAADQQASYGLGSVNYDTGFEGNKVHGVFEGAWENQFVLPGGVAATPYLGGRLDAATYDGASSDPDAPGASSLLSFTPIAAIDVRLPMIATSPGAAHLFEPIAQLVYRGSATTHTGITNDDAQSFVFDTSNLFSYNKFSGIDRQETGLRANIGAHYLGTFDDGSWVDFVAGQSFQLMGPNAYGSPDAAQVGTSTGLNGAASYIVASARGGLSNGLSGGAKIQVDPAAWRITRLGTGVSYAPPSWFSVGADYIYLAADPALGIDDDRQEIAVRASLSLVDYWTLSGSTGWNLETGDWTGATVGAQYDDNYFAYGGSVNFKSASDWGFKLGLSLKGPDGEVAF